MHWPGIWRDARQQYNVRDANGNVVALDLGDVKAAAVVGGSVYFFSDVWLVKLSDTGAEQVYTVAGLSHRLYEVVEASSLVFALWSTVDPCEVLLITNNHTNRIQMGDEVVLEFCFFGEYLLVQTKQQFRVLTAGDNGRSGRRVSMGAGRFADLAKHVRVPRVLGPAAPHSVRCVAAFQAEHANVFVPGSVPGSEEDEDNVPLPLLPEGDPRPGRSGGEVVSSCGIMKADRLLVEIKAMRRYLDDLERSLLVFKHELSDTVSADQLASQ